MAVTILNPFLSGVGSGELAFIGSTTSVGSGTSVTRSAPTRAVGDLLLVLLHKGNSGATVTESGNWTAIDEAGASFFDVYRRVATNTAADDFSATLSVSAGWGVYYVVLRGGGSTVTGGVIEDDSSSPITVPSITMPADGSVALLSAYVTYSGTSPNVTTPSGFTATDAQATTVTGFPIQFELFLRSATAGATGTVSLAGTHSGGGSFDLAGVQVGVSA